MTKLVFLPALGGNILPLDRKITAEGIVWIQGGDVGNLGVKASCDGISEVLIVVALQIVRHSTMARECGKIAGEWRIQVTHDLVREVGVEVEVHGGENRLGGIFHRLVNPRPSYVICLFEEYDFIPKPALLQPTRHHEPSSTSTHHSNFTFPVHSLYPH